MGGGRRSYGFPPLGKEGREIVVRREESLCQEDWLSPECLSAQCASPIVVQNVGRDKVKFYLLNTKVI